MRKHTTLAQLIAAVKSVLHIVKRKADPVDWNENDPSSLSYVKNRPGGYDTRKLVLEGTYELTAFEENGAIVGYAYSNFPFLFYAPRSYEVEFNGDIYNVTSIVNEDILGAEIMGNQSILFGGDDTGEPFLILNIDGNTTQLASKIPGPVTIKITEITNVKVQSKYIDMTVDSAMSDTSTNTVQNKVIKKYVDDNKLTVDSAMSDTSTNTVQNKVIKKYVDDKIPKVTSADNGKFMRVVNGTWAAKSISNAEEVAF